MENIVYTIIDHLSKYKVSLNCSYYYAARTYTYLSQNNIQPAKIEYDIYHNYCVILDRLYRKYDNM